MNLRTARRANQSFGRRSRRKRLPAIQRRIRRIAHRLVRRGGARSADERRGTRRRARASHGQRTTSRSCSPAPRRHGGPAMARRRFLALPLVAAIFLFTAAPALACGGLIGPNGAVNLLKTTTFAGYHNGVEHYVTAFEYAGGGGAFGSLTPLPGVPTNVEKGGDWTLQRLIRETQPPVPEALDAKRLSVAAAGSAQELMKVKVDALDITVLKGGANEIGQWAKDHGFRLPPDAPAVLEFYTRRSPIFLAAAFDADAAKARGQAVGDGTPVHITIPTPNPWVPLRILALGKTGQERVQADVYLMTDRAPAMLPAPSGRNGISLA